MDGDARTAEAQTISKSTIFAREALHYAADATARHMYLLDAPNWIPSPVHRCYGNLLFLIGVAGVPERALESIQRFTSGRSAAW